MIDRFQHIHIIGIGGSGISALATLALTHGIAVSGSDVTENPTTEALRESGADIHIGHRQQNLHEASELVIYSEAIDKKTNPEYLAAESRGLPLMSYFEALGRLSQHKKTIVVAGTHGKTTTTAMLGQALATAGEDPTVIVGARVPAFDGKNIRVGHGPWMVAEGCEYRRSFLNFSPFAVVLLNCELEHVDYYKSQEDYIAAYLELVSKIPEDGFLVFNEDDPHCRQISRACRGERLPVSEKAMEKLDLKVPGDFNQLNANLALKAAKKISENGEPLRKGLEAFAGTARRMEIKGEKEGVLVMDDYGHHPTEVRATLEALKKRHSDRRLICVFQPHQYSRTHQLLEDFATAFEQADIVIVPNIFEARDTAEDKAKISAEKLVEAITAHHTDARWGKGFGATLDMLRKETRPNDLILTMGAGDVYKIGESYLSA